MLKSNCSWQRNGLTRWFVRACSTSNSHKVFDEIPEISIIVGVSKAQPPYGGDVGHVTIEMEEYDLIYIIAIKKFLI
jgi:hypothetical protein